MANIYLREVFPTTEDATNGAGVAITRVIQGQSPTTGGPSGGQVNGMTAFAFKDSAGNLVLPQLDATGKILVSTEGGFTVVTGSGSLSGGVTSGYTIIPGTTVVLVSGKTYVDIDMSVSCSRTAEFQLIQNNNGSLSTLADVLVGSGQFTAGPHLQHLQATAGGAGTQQLYVQGVCLDKASALIATICAVQAN